MCIVINYHYIIFFGCGGLKKITYPVNVWKSDVKISKGIICSWSAAGTHDPSVVFGYYYYYIFIFLYFVFWLMKYRSGMHTRVLYYTQTIITKKIIQRRWVQFCSPAVTLSMIKPIDSKNVTYRHDQWVIVNIFFLVRPNFVWSTHVSTRIAKHKLFL